MSLRRKCLKVRVVLILILIAIILIISILIIGTSVYDDVLKRQSKYHISLKDINSSRLPEKIIFLWTPMFRNYDMWKWLVGPHPLMTDCHGENMDSKCLITTHTSLFEKADVVLFSVQDIKKVNKFIYNDLHIQFL